jgi:hypothetical protein
MLANLQKIVAWLATQSDEQRVLDDAHLTSRLDEITDTLYEVSSQIADLQIEQGLTRSSVRSLRRLINKHAAENNKWEAQQMATFKELQAAVQKVREADAREDEKLLAIIELLKARPNEQEVQELLNELEELAAQDSAAGITDEDDELDV